MQPVFKYIREFYQKDFNWFYFALILLILGTIIYFNYGHSLERRLVSSAKTKPGQFGLYYLLYFIPFAIAFALQPLFFKNCNYWSNTWFWVILFLAPAFFAFRVIFTFHQEWVTGMVGNADIQFWIKCSNWIIRVFVLLIPLFVVWWIKDRHTQPFYGTQPLDNVKPYLLMLLIMVPVIALASTQRDFLNYYPKAKFIAEIYGMGERWRYIVYELCYGFDFVSIEFFFRGFLILSLARICGPHCIIPIACFYCCIHLGKPMGEAISSFFGGILLGIISYNTGSVWGGLIIHLGIAWLMEAGGWLGSLIKK